MLNKNYAPLTPYNPNDTSTLLQFLNLPNIWILAEIELMNCCVIKSLKAFASVLHGR